MRKRTTQGPFYDTVLSTNLRRLIEHTEGGSVNAWTNRHGLNQSTINRVFNGTSDATVGELTKWCEAIGCVPEELLRTGFSPEKLGYTALDIRSRRFAQAFASLQNEGDRLLVESLLTRLASNDSVVKTVAVVLEAPRPPATRAA